MMMMMRVEIEADKEGGRKDCTRKKKGQVRRRNQGEERKKGESEG